MLDPVGGNGSEQAEDTSPARFFASSGPAINLIEAAGERKEQP
jgi:hypothetical protein